MLVLRVIRKGKNVKCFVFTCFFLMTFHVLVLTCSVCVCVCFVCVVPFRDVCGRGVYYLDCSYFAWPVCL